ncbi:MAG: hypothetical protein UY16_C0059G0002 [Candidatus Gottesmanbacteria bacterium GW2011_GWA2_47_9]|uniref:Uncharacterized protein n=1 Tax=Candidatus Gottesmanbacteria bacterium GW2011_GWA2_47_9 TaxID=1618445 RepID=A0A0G1TWP3_9BACT|nr:MAG: hypothetical protein UY16_C0059G0002 [Candidatus Gottesmanbacteria bacterium GW2011_GWA2_47_9]
MISAIVVGVAAGGIGGFFLWQRSQQSAQPEVTAQPTPPEMLTWKDPAGFSFQYPKDVSVNPHKEDEENYAHVELTQKDHPGKLVVWVKDTTAFDASAWVKTEKRFKAANVMDTTLGGQPGKKVLLTDPESLLVSGTVFDELLFMIETTPTDAAYWGATHETVTNSFVFTPLAGEEQAAGAGAADDASSYEEAVDEEEVIQ